MQSAHENEHVPQCVSARLTWAKFHTWIKRKHCVSNQQHQRGSKNPPGTSNTRRWCAKTLTLLPQRSEERSGHLRYAVGRWGHGQRRHSLNIAHNRQRRGIEKQNMSTTLMSQEIPKCGPGNAWRAGPIRQLEGKSCKRALLRTKKPRWFEPPSLSAEDGGDSGSRQKWVEQTRRRMCAVANQNQVNRSNRLEIHKGCRRVRNRPCQSTRR